MTENQSRREGVQNEQIPEEKRSEIMDRDEFGELSDRNLQDQHDRQYNVELRTNPEQDGNMNAMPPAIARNPVQENYEVNQGGQGGGGRGDPAQGNYEANLGGLGGVIRRGGPRQGIYRGVQRGRGGLRGGPVQRGNQGGRGGVISGGRGNGGLGRGLQEQGGLGNGRGG